VSTDRPTSDPNRDDGEGRPGLERRTTDDDRRAAAERAGTRPMPATERPRDEQRVSAAAVPGTARGRLHVGINWGAAFFGWVAAMGLAVILTAFITAVGAAIGITRGATTAQQASDQIQQNAQTVGLLGIILLAVVAFVSYYAGGYVAARMSRFDGPRQGFAVWVWAIIVALVVALVAAVAGARYDVLSTLNTYPRIPVNQGDLTGTGILALVILLAITLLGAVVGGAGGMRYHRKLETAEAQYLTEERDPRER
jgi:MFS family permease